MLLTAVDILSDEWECPECNFELQDTINNCITSFEHMPVGRRETRLFRERTNEMIDKYNDNRGRIFYNYL